MMTIVNNEGGGTPAGNGAAPPAVGRGVGRRMDEDASLRLYLRDIGGTPLLSRDEENALAERLRQGDLGARDQMIRANLRLVVRISKSFTGMGVPLADLCHEGNIGLMRAVERFDPAKGAKLSTYAAWWIKQALRRAVANQGKTIRVPVHLTELAARMRRVMAELQEELGRTPQDEEVAEAMSISPRRVGELWQATLRTASLDAPVGDDDDTRLADLVADDAMPTAFEDLDRKGRVEMMRDLLRSLDPRELAVIRQRFGLDGARELTLEEIGRQFALTRERIRQLEAQALGKLRRLADRYEAVCDPTGESTRRAA